MGVSVHHRYGSKSSSKRDHSI
ncbi:hypothetical protein CY0110_17132 [Crocosphaera chwakensis CCY0110]|uniref:Uncharacterized protein n=1 Tax=Crocosphaera chwakensis CCY0110 TaxID=391612 RepID=A3IIA8_9CHRO|nr:hypothetical protein CY0110_17132 [Crocosphaera chwakensis CCY0110]